MLFVRQNLSRFFFVGGKGLDYQMFWLWFWLLCPESSGKGTAKWMRGSCLDILISFAAQEVIIKPGELTSTSCDSPWRFVFHQQGLFTIFEDTLWVVGWFSVEIFLVEKMSKWRRERRRVSKGGNQRSPAKKVSPKAPWNTAAKQNVKVTLDQVVPLKCVFFLFFGANHTKIRIPI